MGWFADIFTGGAAQVIDSMGNAIDKLVTSDEEKIALRNELMKAQLEAKHKADELSLQMEGQITERWKSDNEHWVTRLVRPLIVLWSFALLTIVILADGNIGNFTIKAAYIPVIEGIVTASVMAYMGVRSLDKYTARKA